MLEVVRVVSMTAGGCQGSVHECWRFSGKCLMLEVVKVVSHAGGYQGSVHACWWLSLWCPCMLEVVRVVSHAGSCPGDAHACWRLSW